MSLTKQLLDDLQRDFKQPEPRYGELEDFYGDGPWPTPEELASDAENEECLKIRS